MKGILKTLLRLLFWLLAAAASAAGLYWLILRLDPPRNAVVAGAALLLAALLGFILTRRLLIRRRRLSQIRKIVNLNPAGLPDEAPDSRLIDKRWLRAVSIMRASYLGRRGDPLYALPWYMVMGKPGAGKSSAIAYSGLNAMLTDVGPEEIGASTRNCDWHFFREAVLLDTAGRYAAPLNEARDDAEWREFLVRLARYRSKEPLNGLVIAVAADTLYGRGEHLLAEARGLRRRIDEIMRLLGAKFPVYLMATKLDLPAGLARLLEALPEESQKQSFGVIVQSPEEKSPLSIETRIGQAIQTFSDRLRNFCLYAGDTAPSPDRIMAWEEFQAMMPALRAYAEEIFAANPYQETPLLRGIFFSSALQGQQEGSRAFPSLSALAGRVFRIRKKVGGVFLHDFFRRVLPADRTLHRPLPEYLRWRSGTRTMAYGAMLLATFGLNLLFSLSFRHNADSLGRMTLPREDVKVEDMFSRALYFEREFRKQAQLEEEIGGLAQPPMGFNQAAIAFRAYSEALYKSFNTHLFNAAAPNMEKKRDSFTRDTDDREFFITMSYYVWLHELLTAADQGRSFEELLKIPAMPQALLSALGLEEQRYLGLSIAYSVARDLYSLGDQSQRRQYLRALRSELARLEEVKSYSLQWIAYRAGALSSLPPVKGDDFWSDSSGLSLSWTAIDPAYTKEGLAVTLEYLKKLNLILAGEARMKPATDDFLRGYAMDYLEAWHSFALDFAEKTAGLATRPASGEALAFMSTAHNPYFTLLLRMEDELGAVRPYLDSEPAWLGDLAVFAQALNLVARANPENEERSLPQRLKKGAQRLYGDLGSDFDSRKEARDAKAQSMLKDVQAVLDSLGGLVHLAMSDASAFSALQEAMPNENNKNAAQAPLALALLATQNLNAKLNPNPDRYSPAYALVSGPMNFFAQRLMNQASCRIQSMWEGNVLARARGSAPSRLQQNLFAEQGGLVRDFADKTLEYILNRSLDGYEPQSLFGLTVPFAAEFLAFINAGVAGYQPARDEYGVTVAALPTSVNEGAAETPYAVELSLHCAREKQEFVNYNSPGSAIFNWRRDSCGDAGLSIRFKSVSLKVLYAGENGFLDFLNDFQYGEKTFRASDFPEEASALGKLGVADITVQYRFSGADELLNSYRAMTGEPPFAAAACER